MTDISPEEILQFWFEVENGQSPGKPLKKWFKATPQMDEAICVRFEAGLIKATQGHYKSWEETARGRLALILLFDQFPRNMYRGTAKAYLYDFWALDLAKRTVDDGLDRQLNAFERLFCYMPFMHAEDSALQEKSVELFEQLLDDVKKDGSDQIPYFENNLKYARQYFDLIKRFNRFPARNQWLNRASTHEELEFLGV